MAAAVARQLRVAHEPGRGPGQVRRRATGRRRARRPRVPSWRSHQNTSRPRYQRGALPQRPVDKMTSRLAARSSSASWMPVWPLPMQQHPAGRKIVRPAVVMCVDLNDRRRESTSCGRDVRRPGTGPPATMTSRASIVPRLVVSRKRAAGPPRCPDSTATSRLTVRVELDRRGDRRLRSCRKWAISSSRAMKPSGSAPA